MAPKALVREPITPVVSLRPSELPALLSAWLSEYTNARTQERYGTSVLVMARAVSAITPADLSPSAVAQWAQSYDGAQHGPGACQRHTRLPALVQRDGAPPQQPGPAVPTPPEVVPPDLRQGAGKEASRPPGQDAVPRSPCSLHQRYRGRSPRRTPGAPGSVGWNARVRTPASGCRRSPPSALDHLNRQGPQDPYGPSWTRCDPPHPPLPQRLRKRLGPPATGKRPNLLQITRRQALRRDPLGRADHHHCGPPLPPSAPSPSRRNGYMSPHAPRTHGRPDDARGPWCGWRPPVRPPRHRRRTRPQQPNVTKDCYIGPLGNGKSRASRPPVRVGLLTRRPTLPAGRLEHLLVLLLAHALAALLYEGTHEKQTLVAAHSIFQPARP